MDDNDKCSEEEEREIKVERRAGQGREGQSDSSPVPHTRAGSHFLAWKRARVEWGPCLSGWPLRAVASWVGAAASSGSGASTPSPGRSGQGTNRDCGCRCSCVMWMRSWAPEQCNACASVCRPHRHKGDAEMPKGEGDGGGDDGRQSEEDRQELRNFKCLQSRPEGH